MEWVDESDECMEWIAIGGYVCIQINSTLRP